ncbi:DUF1028 domain-containing protein [Formosa sp. S-31]|uniref:DUF1028 domain-containing protein n=1 Tax=Formosa sp. S-31 TaxID=2790949 RepID=UPI003EB9D307
MKSFYIFVFLFFSLLVGHAQVYKKAEPYTHTYSIVARDSVTGNMAVAVQSHWFSVGSVVIYGQAGVGVVATQALVNPSYGPNGLKLMSEGKSPKAALEELLTEDEGQMYRQVAFLNGNGDVAAHTGDLCIGEAGHYVGKNFSVQANMMLKNTVWKAMAKAYETTKGDLSTRIIAAMKAAEAEKGDIRGSQSAAIKIVKAESTGNSWEDTVMDLRVEDHENPVAELERLIGIQKAYDFMNKGDVAMEKGDSKLAEELYLSAQKLYPDNIEMQYWYGINLLNNKEFDRAHKVLKPIFKKDNNWKILTGRLMDSKLLSISDEELKKVMSW